MVVMQKHFLSAVVLTHRENRRLAIQTWSEIPDIVFWNKFTYMYGISQEEWMCFNWQRPYVCLYQSYLVNFINETTTLGKFSIFTLLAERGSIVFEENDTLRIQIIWHGLSKNLSVRLPVPRSVGAIVSNKILVLTRICRDERVWFKIAEIKI